MNDLHKDINIRITPNSPCACVLKAVDIPETLLKPNQQILTKIAVKMLFMFGKRLAKVTSIPIDRALKNILFPLLTLKSEKMHLLLLHIHTFHKCF